MRTRSPRVVRILALLAPACVAAALTLVADEARAAEQTTLASPPPELMPGPTKSIHELGFGLNFAAGPNIFNPALHWRMHIPNTARIGQLSGLYLGFNFGPAVGFNGSIAGDGGFELGYEIDPWSNLALTFSPSVHNDFYFDTYAFQFAQVFGPAVRLYINQHWVVYFEPGHIGWNIWTNGDRTHAGFSFRGGVGFAYKF